MIGHTTQHKDYFWNTLGVFAQNAISPLLLIAITRINGINDSGLFSFAFSMAIVFWAFGIWGSRTYQVSDIRLQHPQRSYITVRLILALFMLLGAVVFVMVNKYNLSKSELIILLVMFKAIESIADSIYGVLQINGRLFITGKSLLYKAIFGTILFVAIDLITKDILLASLGIVLANILLVVFYDLKQAQRTEDIKIKMGSLSRYVKDAFKIMKTCFPVFVVFFLSILSLNIPRYFIDLYHAEDIGYFGIIAMPITLIVLLMSFVLQPNVVPLSRLYVRQEYRDFSGIIRKIFLITIFVGLAILLLAFLLGVPVLDLIFGVDFKQYKLALMIIILGGIANALVAILINVLTIMRRFKSQFYTLLVTNILLLVSSGLLINRGGLLMGVTLFTLMNLLQILLLTLVYITILRKDHIQVKANQFTIYRNL